MDEDRRDFLKATAGVYAAAALGARDVAAQAPASADEIAMLSLKDASDLVRRKKVSPLDLTRACLGRVERLNPRLNAFITVTAEQALASARAAEREIVNGTWRGPLHGIPVALKDLFDTAGVRTTAASAVFADR